MNIWFRHWGWGVYLEANPNEGEEQAEGSQDEAVELEAPSERGDPGTAQLDLQTLLLSLATPRWCLVGVRVLNPRTAHPLLPVHPHFTLLNLLTFCASVFNVPWDELLFWEGIFLDYYVSFCCKQHKSFARLLAL